MTNYVMVPVPEDQVADVMQFIVRAIQKANLRSWDEEAVYSFFEESDEATRSLLSLVARGVLLGRPVTDEGASEQIELSLRETAMIMKDANDRAREQSRPFIFNLKGSRTTRPDGRTIEVRHVIVADDVAKAIRAAERALLNGDSLVDAGPDPEVS